ncbi:MAG: hypothetical protein AAGI44_19350, partial [Pseudomonadota bacterium]
TGLETHSTAQACLWRRQLCLTLALSFNRYLVKIRGKLPEKWRDAYRFRINTHQTGSNGCEKAASCREAKLP